MSVTTIQIPAEHITAIRESLLTARRRLEEELSRSSGGPGGPGSTERSGRLEQLDDLLEQMRSGDRSDSESHEVTGSRATLWNAVYDTVCTASELLAEDLNEYWRGLIDSAQARARVAEVRARFELLEALGPPPGGQRHAG